MWYIVGAAVAYSLVMLILEARWVRKEPGLRPDTYGPRTSVIRPVKGLDDDAETIHRTIFTQEYPGFEIIFSLQDQDDPALPLLRRLVTEFPNVDAKVIINPVAHGLSGKASNMVHGLRAARFDTIAFCDADIPWHDPRTLAKLVAPLADPAIGATTAIPVGIDSIGFWGKVMHIFSVMFGFQTLTLVVATSEPKAGLVGGTFVTRKSVIEEIGGLEPFGAHAAEDLAIGRAIGRAGYTVRWMPQILAPIGRFRFRDFYQTVKRWTLAGAKTFRLLWFVGYVSNYGYVWGVLAGFTISPGILAPMLVFAASKVVGSALIAGLVFPRSRAAHLAPLTLWVDVLMAVFTPLFLLRPVIDWRGIRYRIGPGGVMEKVT